MTSEPYVLDTVPSGLLFRFLSYDASRTDRWRSWLTEEEAGSLESFGHRKRQQEFITGRAALRMLLAEQTATAPARIRLRAAEDGAVEAPETGLCVSLAHSDGHAVAVAARHAIGVDFERIQSRRPDLYRFLLHPEEYELLETLPLSLDRFHVLCWTIKEATLKGLRTGFRLSPKKLRLQIDLDAGAAHVAVQDGAAWHVHFQECHLIEDGAAYYWSVATPVAREEK